MIRNSFLQNLLMKNDVPHGTYQESRCGKGKARVFHSSIGEAGRENENIVNAPNVFSTKIFGRRYELLKQKFRVKTSNVSSYCLEISLFEFYFILMAFS